MPDVIQSMPWQKLLAANTTNNSAFATPAVLTNTAGVWTTLPAGAAVIDTNLMGKDIWLRFFGTGGDGATGEVRISAVRRSGVLATSLWVPTPITSFTFTQGTQQGNANTNALAADYYADTLARLGSIGVDNITDRIVSPAALNVPASLLYDARAGRFHLIELRVGTATNVNAEWTLVN